MSEIVRDPVSRVRMSFEPRGEYLRVDLWLEPGGGLPPHLHPRQEEHSRSPPPPPRGGLFNAGGMPKGLAGMRWAARFLKKYQDETVFLSPPRPLQKLLIALFARGTPR